MDQLIAVINELHDAFATVQMKADINLPQIAVVGSQSSGKSSVLEAIVGKDFLPRGSGIVTRCPLVLQLVQLHKKSNEEEWGEFLHKPRQKYTDFNEIHKEILNRTEEVAGKTSITNIPINLKVYSRHVLNLTLVDLPGLVANAVGDQPKDIDRQIKSMVTHYVSQENTIILAVSPANVDIATSASLQLAGNIDPEGVRTVGVMTKLDLMDRGTDAMDVLSGRLVQLRHGFVGVVNRSQQDINDKKGMQASREDELAFFNNHPAYSAISEQHGTGFLTKKLNHLLLEHIKAVIPNLKTNFEKLIMETHAKMEKLGMFSHDDIDSSDNLLCLIKLFCDAINETIDGYETDEADELVGGARLDYIFHEWFAQQLDSLTASDVLTDEYVRVNSRNMMGINATLLPSDKTFVSFAKKQIARLQKPSKECVSGIHSELVKIVEKCAFKLDRFPKLKNEVSDKCRDMLQDYLIFALEHVKRIIDSEQSFINVKHPRIAKLAQQTSKIIHEGLCETSEDTENADLSESPGSRYSQHAIFPQYRKTANQSTPLPKTNGIPEKCTLQDTISEYEKKTNNAIQKMVEGYFEIVKENIADHIPKAIFLLMVSKLRQNVYATLIKELYNDKNMDQLMEERPESAEERNRTAQMMEALKKAKQVLDNVQDYSLTGARNSTTKHKKKISC